jgi:hypothetical protein
MNANTSPCAIDNFLATLNETDRSALRRFVDMLDLRFAFLNGDTSGPGGLEATLLSPRHLVPVRQLPGGRWDVRVLPLALVLSLALREEAEGLELQLELYQFSPVVLRWPGVTLVSVADDKAFQLLMNTCGFAINSHERPGRLGFRGLG